MSITLRSCHYAMPTPTPLPQPGFVIPVGHYVALLLLCAGLATLSLTLAVLLFLW
jgi:hypothetical protein